MRLKRHLGKALLLCAATVSLSACNTTGQMNNMDASLQQAAMNARSAGKPEESLALLEQVYKRNSDNQDAAWKYARALRHEGYFNRADLILKPFVSGDKGANADVLIEYASIQAAMGNYISSETYAREAVKLAPDSGQAYHVLGITLDAQGHHPQAQTAFEKGLEHWEGDPSPILNNMGLNLAAQGFLDDAIDTLRRALDTAPNRKEIERNLRIVSALQFQPPREGTRLIPHPPKKPKPLAKMEPLGIKTSDKAETVDSVPVEPVEEEAVE